MDRNMDKSHVYKQSRICRSKLRVLVVDDDCSVAETLRDLLRFKGFDVETAENGKQAIDLIKRPHHFDLMITDMRMPEMDGLELLKAIRQLKTDLPIIILTGYATVENGIHSMEQGAYDYLFKPFNIEELMQAMNRALSRSRPDLEGTFNRL